LHPASGIICTPATILVPLVAFDQENHRIGYGRGYYDRALVHHSDATSIGLAFKEQEVDHIPADPWDRRLNVIVSV
jgi:5-formyltetrahydrofolate cyclo-ligase